MFQEGMLKGQTILITGGGSGLGLAMAERLGGLGARIGICGRRAEVLGLERVGIYDHFLDLGGDSLLASQVITQVIARMSVALPVARLLAAPTVADMASTIVDALIRETSPEDFEKWLADIAG